MKSPTHRVTPEKKHKQFYFICNILVLAVSKGLTIKIYIMKQFTKLVLLSVLISFSGKAQTTFPFEVKISGHGPKSIVFMA